MKELMKILCFDRVLKYNYSAEELSALVRMIIIFIVGILASSLFS